MCYVERAKATNPQSFAGLRALECHGPPTVILSLITYLKDLQSLDMTLAPDTAYVAWYFILGQDIVSVVSKCHNLKSFRLYLVDSLSTRMVASQLIELAQACLQLQSLEIEVKYLKLDNFDDAQFNAILPHLPNLRKLNMKMTNISGQSLVSLGTHCPQLEGCELGGEFDLSMLRTSNRVLFPKLHTLLLTKFAHGKSPSPEAWAAILFYHAPYLEHWAFTSPWGEYDRWFEKTVKEAHASARGEPVAALPRCRKQAIRGGKSGRGSRMAS